MSIDTLGVLRIVAFILVAALVIALGIACTARERIVAHRVRKLGQDVRARSTGSRTGTATASGSVSFVERGLFGKGKEQDRLKTWLAEAGIYFACAPTIYVIAGLLLAIVFTVACLLCYRLGFIPPKVAFILAIPLGAIGFQLPRLWIENRRARRHLLLRRAIPDFLDLIVACLCGGLSVLASLRQVTDELRLAHPELSKEFGIALREMELGSSLDRALQQLSARTGLEELKTLRTFIQQTTKFGTTITDALGQMAEMLRVQREQRAEELAQKAAVKILFPTMLFIFPTVFVVLAAPAAIQIREGLFKSQGHSAVAK